MKQAKKLVLIGTLLASVATHADTITGEVLDTLPGKGAIGISGFLLGGFATGGPAGALLGGTLGWLVGGEAQEVIGVGGTAYRVRKADGSEVTVRSPNRSWSVGDQVQIIDNRLVAERPALAASSR